MLMRVDIPYMRGRRMYTTSLNHSFPFDKGRTRPRAGLTSEVNNALGNRNRSILRWD